MSDTEDKSEEPIVRIPYARQCIDDADIESVVAALKSDFVTQGPRTEHFEDALCEVVGVRHAVAVSSGTAALHLAMLGLGLGKGDYGLVPAITFAATANCLRFVNAGVGFADVDPLTGVSSSADFESALARSGQLGQLKALLPVSFSGVVPDLENLAALAAKQGAYLVEDAAHSIGARYRSSGGSLERSGSCRHSDAAILSFHPVKHICAGEGGAVLTNDEVLANRVRRLRSHGIDKLEDWRYNQSELGFNYRMTELQAALGLSQLGKLDTFVQRRSELANRYLSAFEKSPFAEKLVVSTRNPLSSWHLFVVQFSNASERKAAYEFLRSKGIFSQVHYMPVYRHEYYATSLTETLAGAERFSSCCLSLPLYPSLADEDQDYVLDVLREFMER